MQTSQIVLPLLVLIVYRDLSEALRPCFVHRQADGTVLFVHPGTPRVECVAWAIDHLTVEERNYIRAHAGEPPVGERLSDEYINGLCGPSRFNAEIVVQPLPRAYPGSTVLPSFADALRRAI